MEIFENFSDKHVRDTNNLNKKNSFISFEQSFNVIQILILITFLN
jgi:hypothetical protein